MSFTQVGSCPHCGAPLYSPMAWWGIMPPPVQYSCNCAAGKQGVVTTDNTYTISTKGTSGATNEW